MAAMDVVITVAAMGLGFLSGFCLRGWLMEGEEEDSTGRAVPYTPPSESRERSP